MAFTDYLDLRIAVSEYSGKRIETDVFQRLVTQAETRLNRKLRHQKMISTATVTMSSGVGSLPTDFQEMLSVFVAKYQLLSEPLLKVQNGSVSGYSIAGGSLYIYGSDASQAITYYAKLATITTSVGTTNWLLSDGPDVYLYAVGLELAKFYRDNDLISRAEQDLAGAMMELKVDGERAQWSNARVRMAGQTP